MPIVPVLRRHLAELWEAQGRPIDGPVIRAQDGKPIAAEQLSRYYWKPVAKAAGAVRADGTLLGFHSIRHAAVSLWIKAGLGDLALKAVVGHASVTTTKDVYGHLYASEEDAGEAMGSSMTLLRLTSEPAHVGTVVAA